MNSPARVPSGWGCSVNTCQVSTGPFLHGLGARATPTQLGPTWSNTTDDVNAGSPLNFEAGTTQPLGRHTERSPYVPVDVFAFGSPTPSSLVARSKSIR